jgi:hypothetical protein
MPLPLPGSDPVPAFLQERLVALLTRRAAERAALTAQLGTVAQPNIEDGIYTGPFQWLSDNYAVQATAFGLVQHDRLLLSGTLPGVGDTAAITYRDGVARV